MIAGNRMDHLLALPPAECNNTVQMLAPYHPPVKRSVQIDGHKTSVSLEPLFWGMLKSAADRRGLAINALVARIDAERIEALTPPGLASAIRIWLVSDAA